jgi:hypothetical protein
VNGVRACFAVAKHVANTFVGSSATVFAAADGIVTQSRLVRATADAFNAFRVDPGAMVVAGDAYFCVCAIAFLCVNDG